MITITVYRQNLINKLFKDSIWKKLLKLIDVEDSKNFKKIEIRIISKKD